MKTIILGLVAAAATLTAGAALAQPYGYDAGRGGYDSRYVRQERLRDSDRDGIPDRAEWGRDRDRDGRPDQFDCYDNRRDRYWREHHRHDRWARAHRNFDRYERYDRYDR